MSVGSVFNVLLHLDAFFLLPPDCRETISQCPFTSRFLSKKNKNSPDGLENMPAFEKEMGNTLAALWIAIVHSVHNAEAAGHNHRGLICIDPQLCLLKIRVHTWRLSITLINMFILFSWRMGCQRLYEVCIVLCGGCVPFPAVEAVKCVLYGAENAIGQIDCLNYGMSEAFISLFLPCKFSVKIGLTLTSKCTWFVL